MDEGADGGEDGQLLRLLELGFQCGEVGARGQGHRRGTQRSSEGDLASGHGRDDTRGTHRGGDRDDAVAEAR